MPANPDFISAFRFENPGPYLYWKTGKIVLPVSLLIRLSLSISSRLDTNGFSQITCLPASNDFLQAEKCKWGGRQISMISISLIFNTSSKLSETLVSEFGGIISLIGSLVSPQIVWTWNLSDTFWKSS